MPSAIEPIPATNSSSGAANFTQASGRPSLRPSASTKGDSRRQSGSPSDGGQRRTNSQKAWTQGTNPITQRASYSQSNGNMSKHQSGSPRPTQKESITADSPVHDRLARLISSFTGLQTTITTKTGDKFTGIYSFSALESSDTSFLLKMVRNSSESNAKSNGLSESISPYLGTAPDHSMSFETKDIVDFSVSDVAPTEVAMKESNGSAGFRTDSDISGNLAMRERTLQRWQPAETDHDLSLESAPGDNAGWDQFEANERLFGTRTNYDENIYTTRLDRSDPAFRQKQVEATRIAREIEGNQVENPHMREERGLASDAGDEDEEDKYSGVRRENKAFPPLLSGQPNKYTPPGRRQVAPQPAAPKSASAAVASAPVPPQAVKEIPSEENPQMTKTNIEKTTLGKTALPAAPKRTPENATANVETEVLDQFRQFSASEKLRVAERRRNQVSHDRTIKLNELMKFSKNFKLSTPVPKDLVPILAKDPHKQEAIIQRGQQSVDDTSPPNTAAQVPDQKPPVRASGPNGLLPPTAPSDRQNFARGRQGYPPTGPLAGPGGKLPQQPMQQGRPGTGMLGNRLADNLQQRKGAAASATGAGQVAPSLPIQEARAPPTGPASDQLRVTSPAKTQAATATTQPKFNVRAMEFKPNPTASTFTPGGAPAPVAGPAASRHQSVSRVANPSTFFGARKPRPASERPAFSDGFNPIKRMKKESLEAAQKKDKDKPPFPFNGGIPFPYSTFPTWDIPKGNEEKTFDQAFKHPSPGSSISPQSRTGSNNPNIPQQHIPFPYPQGNPGMQPSSGPPNGPMINHPHGHQGDDHRIHGNPASAQGGFRSPRMLNNHAGYPSVQPGMSFGQPPFYGGPQPNHMRHPYQGGPQFIGPPGSMGAPMMVQNPSNGPYMNVPQGMPYNGQMQMPMYSPSPGHAYPHVPQPQPQSGYPSPSRGGAPMMMHQNSQSDHPQPMMFMSPGQPGYGQPHMPPGGRGGHPHFPSSPHQVHHVPHNQHRGNGFNQVPQLPPHMPSHTPSNSGPTPQTAGNSTDEAK
ncbi:hypothetical protein N7495_005577 [Penicillium taxi]|uniref:uncharacterized protein n=1 Tax=Penicillium taxi TaxID=168475 RepID=UPI0025450241|nr:uncharacterized protein N7495_005577 [Penicillium taxi]KAJ5893886.1 hypothetical protein N7495_005577 [Penicillium taxi]